MPYPIVFLKQENIMIPFKTGQPHSSISSNVFIEAPIKSLPFLFYGNRYIMYLGIFPQNNFVTKSFKRMLESFQGILSRRVKGID